MKPQSSFNFFIPFGFCLVLVTSACKKTDSETTQPPAAQKKGILVFAKTAGFRHASIADGLLAIQKLGKENNFSVDTTTNAAYFTADSLKRYAAVAFLSTTGNVLNDEQQTAFENFIKGGGGFAGIHGASNAEANWPWYNKLVGAYFLDHPAPQTAVVVVNDKTHPSTSALPERWERFDEWYNFKNIMPGIRVLASLDETTYTGGKHGANHPIAWYHDVDGGRSWYTALGHTKESYYEPLFLQHLLGGIKYAMGRTQD
jgi:type 1 glutamine amidotransferase